MADKNKKDLHVKNGDRVIVLSGKDKGKIGNIKKADPSKSKVTVEGANMVTKAQKPQPMAALLNLKLRWMHQM